MSTIPAPIIPASHPETVDLEVRGMALTVDFLASDYDGGLVELESVFYWSEATEETVSMPLEHLSNAVAAEIASQINDMADAGGF